jgi:FkbM family methyltransferase
MQGQTLLNVDIYNMNPLLAKFVRAYQVYKARGAAGLLRSARAAMNWPLLRYKPGVLCQVSDYVLFVNTKDFGISRELFMYGIHEPITTTLMQQELQEGMNVIDIGANLGYYVILEAKLVSPGGGILAIEPYPESVSLLRKNVLANRMENIVVVKEVAVGASSGYADMYTSSRTNWNSMIPFAQGQPSIRVEVCPVDEIEELGKVNFVRMDIEGYETEALKGMGEILRRDKPLLCIELHPHIVDPWQIKEALMALGELGYEVKYAYLRKCDLIGIAKLEHVEKLTISDLIKSDSPISKRKPYTVWLG